MDQFLEQLRSLGLSNPEEVHEKMVNEDVTSIWRLLKLNWFFFFLVYRLNCYKGFDRVCWTVVY